MLFFRIEPRVFIFLFFIFNFLYNILIRVTVVLIRDGMHIAYEFRKKKTKT